MEFYQACFGKPADNWQIFNLSPNTPPNMVTLFEYFGNGCTPQNIGTDVPVDIDGNPVCLYELISTEDTICVLRAKYGERDSFGRPKMFAHGFLFRAEGCLDNPNSVLSVSDANFHFTTSETEAIPDELIFDGELSFDKAMEKCGLDSEKHAVLLACVYSVLSHETDFPLYVKCENNLEVIKSAIFCILSALPAPVRYLLSFSNADSFSHTKFKRIMFVDSVPAGANYFDMKTSETNLTGELNHIRELPPYRAFISRTYGEFATYCKTVENNNRLLNKPYAVGLDEINLACELASDFDSINTKNDIELNRYLLEMMLKLPMQNLKADSFIYNLLVLFEKRNLQPAENIIKRLEQRVDNTASPELVGIYKRVVFKDLLSKGIANTLLFLTEQYKKSITIFSEWVDTITSISNGDIIICEFYIQKILAAETYDELAAIKAEFSRYNCREENVNEAIVKKIVEIGSLQLRSLDLTAVRVDGVFIEIRETLIKVFGNQSYEKECFRSLKADFWRQYDYSGFRFNMLYTANINALLLKNDVSFAEEHEKRIRVLLDIYNAVVGYANSNKVGYTTVQRAVEDFDNTKTFSAHDKKAISETILRFILKEMKQRDGMRHFFFWAYLVSMVYEDENPVFKMIEMNLPIVCSSNCFSDALSVSGRMQAGAKDIGVWLHEVLDERDKLKISGEAVKALKTNLKTVNDFIKENEAREKARDRDKRKKQSGSGDEADRGSDGASPGFVVFDNEDSPKRDGEGFFGGLFKKKKK